ncbi:hypothetical protein SAMN04487928_10485 [Butyrivibrio proteoclasticus]|uniref:Uncharacterized protein n=1 Tax=Butyrivibrio proteoclasticus TaxID=43305 RepID=A0A1I5RLE6_9FIRM|nr:hypothetical protein [Butyrivibrio proteoclasticus]SFP59365.1 hypothetical protein SAMN04487928_10485 [Butyrivibrio proteoclasticus]
MKKRVELAWKLIAILLAIVLVIPGKVCAYNSDEHDKFLREVLFGDPTVDKKRKVFSKGFLPGISWKIRKDAISVMSFFFIAIF